MKFLHIVWKNLLRRKIRTIFTVLLPAVTSPRAAVEGVADDRDDRRAAAVDPTGATVLIVEDDPGVRAFATQVLREGGWTVLDVEDPAGALAIAASESQPLDLVLTDVVLPGIHGSELATRLRALRPGLPVLFMSGYAPEEILASAALPIEGQLLQKPFTPAALRQRVTQALKLAIEG